MNESENDLRKINKSKDEKQKTNEHYYEFEPFDEKM
jgi:hypothetical protein